MAALAVNTPRTIGQDTNFHSEHLGVKGGVKIWAGAALMWTAGFIEPYDGVSADLFAGFALEGVDATGKSDGDLQCDVCRTGQVELVIAATIAFADEDKAVYASTDDNTFNLTSASNMPIGKITRVITTGASGANLVRVDAKAAGFGGI